MQKILPISFSRWKKSLSEVLLSAVSFAVFAALDLVDVALCFFFRFFDAVVEGRSRSSSSSCYCRGGNDEGGRISKTLISRKNIFRELRFLKSSSWRNDEIWRNEVFRSPRWSDCRCEICVSWISKGDDKLHFVVKEPNLGDENPERTVENIIFLHGFLSSSSLWTEMVFPYVSPLLSKNFRLFAVDLLGFGKSPKPGHCLYTLEDHVEMIEKTLIRPFHLDSFHVVAHSMGCIIALAIAEKFPGLVKSITLAAPPFFSLDEVESHSLLKIVVPRKIWPPLTFGASVMSWYEHLGRSICFFVCRYHTLWERILKLITQRDLHFMIVDLTKHTHHSAWHTMHNVICGVNKSMAMFLETLNRTKIPGLLIHGSDDRIAPLDCSYRMKERVPHLDLMVLPGLDHSYMIMGRERDFTRDLERFLFSINDTKTHL